MARSPELNLIVSEFCFLTRFMFTVRSLGKKKYNAPGDYVCAHGNNFESY